MENSMLLLLSRFSPTLSDLIYSVWLCDPIDGSPPGSPVPGILQARTMEWVAIPFSHVKSASEVAQLCPTPSDPTDSSLRGSSVHGIFQAGALDSMEGLKKLKTELPHDTATPLLYSEKNKVLNYVRTSVFTAALFTIAKTWKQPECSSPEE